MSCTTHIRAQTNVLRGAGNQVAIMKQTMLEKPAKKTRNLFFITFFSLDEEKRFLLGFFYWRQTICYLFYSRSCGRRFKFFVDGIRILDGFLHGISLLLSNTLRSINLEQREFL